MGWLKQITLQNDSAWLKLLKVSEKNILNIISLGGDWFKKILKKVNLFWKDVFQNWILMCKNYNITCNQEIYVAFFGSTAILM